MLTPVSDHNGQVRAACSTLVGIARAINVREGELASLRSDRDAEIQRLSRNNAVPERELAKAASVSPSYAHRAVVHGRMARRMRA